MTLYTVACFGWWVSNSPCPYFIFIVETPIKNTRWAFAQKHDKIFSCELISPLLWLNKNWRLSRETTVKAFWFGLSLVLWYKKENITWPLGETEFLFSCWRNISLHRCAHSYSVFYYFSARPCSIHLSWKISLRTLLCICEVL